MRTTNLGSVGSEDEGRHGGEVVVGESDGDEGAVDPEHGEVVGEVEAFGGIASGYDKVEFLSERFPKVLMTTQRRRSVHRYVKARERGRGKTTMDVKRTFSPTSTIWSAPIFLISSALLFEWVNANTSAPIALAKRTA